MNVSVLARKIKKALPPKWYALFYLCALKLFPAIRLAGGVVEKVTPDFRHIRIRLPYNWRTRNAVGTTFGGSIYASADPFFMLQFMEILGDEYVVWDKASNIRFRRPVNKTIWVDFIVTDEMLKNVYDKLNTHNEADFVWTVVHKDKDGMEYTEIVKTIYIAKKSFYKNKRKSK